MATQPGQPPDPQYPRRTHLPKPLTLTNADDRIEAIVRHWPATQRYLMIPNPCDHLDTLYSYLYKVYDDMPKLTDGTHYLLLPFPTIETASAFATKLMSEGALRIEAYTGTMRLWIYTRESGATREDPWQRVIRLGQQRQRALYGENETPGGGAASGGAANDQEKRGA